MYTDIYLVAYHLLRGMIFREKNIFEHSLVKGSLDDPKLLSKTIEGVAGSCCEL